MMLRVSEPILGDEERSALLDVIDSGWITMGPRVEAFEAEFARTHAASQAVAVNSCTSGLHLSLVAFGIGPGDEVLVPSLTFVASANSILYTGATPVFVDIASLETPLMCIEDAAAKVTPRTRAVLLVHFAGYVLGRDLWTAFAREHNLILIEDAAHAAGARSAGTFGSAAIFSFYGNKNMTTAEGGMILVADDALAEQMRRLRAHGLTSTGYERMAVRSSSYDVPMLGFNYRMDELRAALGMVQLRSLFEWNEKRRQLTGTYHQILRAQQDTVVMPFALEYGGGTADSSYHILPVVLPPDAPRSAVMRRMLEDEIQTTIHYPPCHHLSYYERTQPGVLLPKTEEFGRRELTLPLYPGMETDDVARVCLSLQAAVRHAQHEA
ncbi:DegT/DnrJ/EryC1/StrS family aminotransferase [Methylobacterium planeticum]|uniref:DegT/DnrJ/EryC1/StrS family aminotransferase n=1 Tax=Methylobacterium planeticum TaxID=2615211 RepID=A0A6N6MIB9_9HYPH|nr:DegT/DnrJ/EryC1/StrS family aminotransferase [Methylobacterium planeticum]KAB1070776.1 DegT/DnrJ/EryC1/StrS family aminotransferase [Methylobacterium planeticum]